ncbi:MAG: endonuclease MutS2 [Lachnospiraceae bacterium]|jgi:DNA mismatch repair protein MutS2
MNKKVLHTLEYEKITEKLASFADSEPGKAAARALTPLTDLGQIRALQKETDDALRRIFAKGKVSFEGVTDIRGSLRRLKADAPLGCGELLKIAELLACAGHVRNYYEEETDSLYGLLSVLDDLEPLRTSITRAIVSEDEVADSASPKLRSLRREQDRINEKIHSELTRMLTGSLRGCLQDAVITTRQGRYCLPVKAEYRSRVPGMIHDQSASGSTLFIEPEAVVRFDNDLKTNAMEQEKEIAVILKSLSEECAQYTDILEEDYTILTRLDLIFAKGALARSMKASAPALNDEGIFDIRKGRHPLIDPKRVVPIDIRMGTDFHQLVITGPNTGGKTVTLKTVGLLTLMAQSGLLIPAGDHSTIAVYREIYADIGDEQSIEQNLSTFSAHMTNTISILRAADSHCLILFDEIGAGTDPTEGAALAMSILAKLHERGIETIATTHYSELKAYALSEPDITNACCEFDVETLAPTYRLLIGIPGKSNAFAISKKLGLPDEILDDAKRRLSDDQVRFEDLLSDLEKTRSQVEKEHEEAARYKAEAEKLQEELTKQREAIARRKDKILRRANENAEKILADAKAYADESIRELNRHGADVREMEKTRQGLREKLKKNEKYKKPETEESAEQIRKHPASDYKPGVHVRVLSSGLEGDVTQAPDKKGRLKVLIGSMTMTVPVKEVAMVENYKAPQVQEKKPKDRYEELLRKHRESAVHTGALRMEASQNVPSEINVIGMTVDEAVSRLSKYLDSASLAGLREVRIVHGKGTGALRAGIWNWLDGLGYIRGYRIGKPGEGDAGVTIVSL